MQIGLHSVATGYEKREKGKVADNHTHNYIFFIQFLCTYSDLHLLQIRPPKRTLYTMYKPKFTSTPNILLKSTIYSFGLDNLKGLLVAFTT